MQISYTKIKTYVKRSRNFINPKHKTATNFKGVLRRRNMRRTNLPMNNVIKIVKTESKMSGYGSG